MKFNSGLDLVLENACDTLNYDLKSPLGINIENKQEFISNLANNKKLLQSRNKPFRFRQLQCPECSFHSESQMVIDQHLTQPHHYTTVFICNFCPNMKTHNRDEYRHHLQASHGRICQIEKPISQYMCSICDYECGI